MAVFRRISLPILAISATFLLLVPSLVPAHASTDIVLYASKATVRAGTWAVVADATAAGGYASSRPRYGGGVRKDYVSSGQPGELL